MSAEAGYVSLHQLVDAVELVDVRTIELSAALMQPRDGTEEVFLQLATAAEEGDWRLSFRAQARQPDADLAVAVQLRYVRRGESPPLTDIAEEVAHDFIQKVGIMSAFPFLREGLIDIASRLRVDPPILSLLRAGEFSIGASRQEGDAE